MDNIETQMVKLEKDVEYMAKNMDDIKIKMSSIDNKIDAVHERLDTFANDIHIAYVKKDEFIFWRNLIVSGLLTAIALGVIIGLVTR